MRSQRVVIVGLVLLAAGACRTDPAVTMLENENRQLEDVIYRQQDVIQKYRRALEGCRAGQPTPSKPPATMEGPRLGPARPTLAPQPPQRGPAETGPPEVIGPPVIELPTEPAPAGEVPDTLKLRGREPGPLEEAPPFRSNGSSGGSQPAAGPASGASFRGGSAQVAQITLPKVVTWDDDTHQSSGDEGISLVVAPRDAAGRLVEAAAPVSVVVLDPAMTGEAARVARWDFSAQDVARRFRRSSLGNGIQLEMVWPGTAPAHSRLHLFVRYTTDDGRNVEADQPIEVSVFGGQGPNWQPSGPDAGASQENRTATDRRRRPVSTARRPAPASPRSERRPSAWSPDRP